MRDGGGTDHWTKWVGTGRGSRWEGKQQTGKVAEKPNKQFDEAARSATSLVLAAHGP